jgi:amino acid permease
LFTFIKVNLITGFLFLPAGFKEGGWVFSIIDVVAVSIFIVYCNIALADCTEATNSYSFTTIGEKSFGKVGKYAVEYGIAISQILFPCGYANLIASQINQLVQNWAGIDYNVYWFVGIGLLAIFIPLSYVKDITVFSKLHILGDIAVASTVLVLGGTCISILSENGLNQSGRHMDTFGPGWSKTLGMTITMLEGVGLVLPIKVI